MRAVFSSHRWQPTPLIQASAGLHAAAALGCVAHPDALPWALAAIASNHAGLAAAAVWPQSTLLGPNLSRLPGTGGQARIALTFDDGPDPAVTPRVMDILDRFGVQGSFFCIGRRAAAHPGTVRDIVRRGHAVENHSDRHSPAFACMPLSALRRDVAEAQARLSDLTGEAPRFFRAPMGIRSPLLDPVLAELGLQHVSWTRRGYDTVCRCTDTVLRRLVRGLGAGDILLLHDGASRPGRPAVVLPVLPRLLAHAAAQGLRFAALRVAEEAGRRGIGYGPAAPGAPVPGTAG